MTFERGPGLPGNLNNAAERENALPHLFLSARRRRGMTKRDGEAVALG